MTMNRMNRMYTYQPSRKPVDIQGFDQLFRHSWTNKKFGDFAFFHQRTDYTVDIHNIYEINLISNQIINSYLIAKDFKITSRDFGANSRKFFPRGW